MEWGSLDLVAHPSFEEKINKSGEHWLWTGVVNPKGYGYYADKRVHRLAYEKFVGPIPAGVIVRHTCDIRHCVRPDHLALGSPADNSKDMKDRGRQARGAAHSQAKLTAHTVRGIRKMIGYGFTQRRIAAFLCIDPSTISDIKRGKSWGWLS